MAEERGRRALIRQVHWPKESRQILGNRLFLDVWYLRTLLVPETKVWVLFWNQDCDVVSNLIVEIAIYHVDIFHSARLRNPLWKNSIEKYLDTIWYNIEQVHWPAKGKTWFRTDTLLFLWTFQFWRDILFSANCAWGDKQFFVNADGCFLPIVLELLIVLQKSGGAFAMSLWVETVCAVVINKNCLSSPLLSLPSIPQILLWRLALKATTNLNSIRTGTIKKATKKLY